MDNYALDSHYGVEGAEGEEYDDFNESGSLGEYSGAGQHDSHGFGGYDNFKVVIRVRPPLARELRGGLLRPYQCTIHVDPSGRIATISENLPAVLQQGQMGPMMDPSMLYATYRFTFDYVYDQDSTQEELYLRSAQHVVLSILQGYNAAMIAYGQTGTGKTYTVEGDLEGPNRGIIPRTVEDIFTYIVNDPEPTSKYLVRASYLQIYNEVISDLLKPDRTNLAIREDKRRGVFVEGLSEWVVRSPGEVYQLMSRGQSLRATGATKLNEMSSRSHAVCIIIVEKCTTNVSEEAAAALSRPTSSREGGLLPHNIKVGKLNLVDLAGSERVHVTGAVGKRLEESKKINASLSALGNVIAALTDPRGERTHIPYRDSKLTRILEDSLGGNCRTTMVCTVAPSMEAFQESLSTLKFANRAKSIKNEAHVNEDLDQKTLLRKYERELRRLRQELQRRSKQLVDKRSLLEAEEQKRRAEADKLAALTALEKRSKEFLKEKEEKKALEMKIRAMQSQMLVGGVALGPGGSEADAAAGGPARAPVPGNGNAASWENAPAFKQLLLKEHRRIRDEYEKRLKELEGERQTVEEDRLQVDRYKQLLLKQRDIMIALTARLNERDEQIMALQEELEACDKYQQQLEDALDAKTAELIALRKAAVEHATSTGQPVQEGSTLDNILGAWSGGKTPGPAPRPPIGEDGRRAQESGTSGAQGAVEVKRLDDQPQGGYARQPSTTLSGGGGSENSLPDALRRAQAGAANNASSSSNGNGSHAQLADRVDMLTAACTTAQRERAALQQILESKVKRMMSDMAQEMAQYSSANGGPPGSNGVSERLASKLRAIESVVDKINLAIKGAPPILPAEDEGLHAEDSY